jgi:acyl carrier protein
MNETKFIDFIKKSLQEKDQLIEIDTRLKDIKKWDSLASVRVLLELSNKLNKKFEINDIVNFKDLRELYKYFTDTKYKK